MSRLCKLAMFQEFHRLCLAQKRTDLVPLTRKLYLEAKTAAKHYREAQVAMEKRFADFEMGVWTHKPLDEKSFNLLWEFKESYEVKKTS